MGSINLDPIPAGNPPDLAIPPSRHVATIRFQEILRSKVDFSTIEARLIIFARRIDQGSVVKVRAAGGKVLIVGKLDGGSELSISAPGGEVDTVEHSGFLREGSKIDGGSKLRVEARIVRLRGVVNGPEATQIYVFLTKGGQLDVRELDGAATIYYLKGDPTDPDPLVRDRKGGRLIQMLPNGNGVQLWEPHRHPNQQWVVERVDGSPTPITSALRPMVLDAEAGNVNIDGGGLQVWQDLGGGNQRWMVVPAGDGTYRIACCAGGKVLGTDGANGAGRVQIHSDLAGPNQRWRLEPVPGKPNTYVILNAASNKALDTHFPWDLP